MRSERAQHRKWLIEFGALSLALIVVVGLVLSQSAGKSIRERASRGALREAQVLVRTAFEQGLATGGRRAALTPGQRSAIDRALRPSQRSGDVVGVVVRDRRLARLYTSERLADRRAPNRRALQAALAGAGVSEISRLPSGGQVLRNYVALPTRAGRRLGGVVEVQMPHAPIAAAVAHETKILNMTVWGSLSLLYAALLAIVAIASKTLRRTVADKHREALLDPLTGLPNRALFLDLARRAVTGRFGKKPVAAVMIMDLNHFKEVNDTLGHHSGDMLLQMIGTRLREVLGPSMTLARLGGDEFAILVPNADREAVLRLARAIVERLEEPVVVGGLTLRVEASIGVAFHPDHGAQVPALMRAADVAMYAAKAERSGYQVYSSEQERHDAAQLALVGEFRRAIEADELVLYYQPKVDLRTDAVTGVEALARWRHPRRGLLGPDQFIPLAEHSHLLKPVTLHLLETALRQQSAWRAEGHDLKMAVNLSMQNLLDVDLPADLGRLLKKWWIEPHQLELEITESTVMTDRKRTLGVLTTLSNMGIDLSIDDFGTGYSSLAYLKELPVGRIKIDKSFVMTMMENDDNATIVQSTVDLGHNLGLEVVAEGVETNGALNHLRRLGCDLGQGYFFSKPLPPDELLRWFSEFTGAAIAEVRPPTSRPPQRPAPDVIPLHDSAGLQRAGNGPGSGVTALPASSPDESTRRSRTAAN